MEVLVRNVGFGGPMLRKNPGLVVAAILTLALAIGVNTAMFSVASALLLRPFPYSDPEQLVTIEAKDQSKEFGGTLLRYELLRNRHGARCRNAAGELKTPGEVAISFNGCPRRVDSLLIEGPGCWPERVLRSRSRADLQLSVRSKRIASV
jgi:hypothetical protein